MVIGMERGEEKGKNDRVKTGGSSVDDKTVIKKARGRPRKEESKAKDGLLEKYVTRKTELALPRATKSRSSDISGRNSLLRRKYDANNSFVNNTTAEKDKIENVLSNKLMEANMDDGAEGRSSEREEKLIEKKSDKNEEKLAAGKNMVVCLVKKGDSEE